MGRLIPAHYDDVFLTKIKSVCLHVLDQLNADNEIEQAFDLCPSISRRNRVILSFLRNTDHHQPLNVGAPTHSSALASATAHDDDAESVSSLSAQRRRHARGIQFVRDPNDSPDEVEPLSTTQSRSTDPVPFPALPLPDYTYEQFADHFDPDDKFFKRIFEIIIKETARQALRRKQGLSIDSSSAINARNNLSTAQSEHRRLPMDSAPRTGFSDNFARRMRHIFNNDEDSSSRDTTGGSDYTDFARRMQLMFSREEDPLNATSSGSLPTATSTSDTSFRVVQPAPSARGDGSRSVLFTRRLQPLSLRDETGDTHESMLDSLLRSQGTADAPTFSATAPLRNRAMRRRYQQSQNVSSAPYAVVPSTVRNTHPTDLSPQVISDRLAAASRRNAEAARTIDQANRLASSSQRSMVGDMATDEAGGFQSTLVRHSIESLRVDLMRLHTNYAIPPARPLISTDLTSINACVLGCIELFEDLLRRLSSYTRTANHVPTVIRLARDHLLVSSMARQAQEQEQPVPRSDDLSADVLRAHRHLFATIEEAHWTKPDLSPPSAVAIRAWRRKLACWYFLDCNERRYASPIINHQALEEPYPRWTPHSEMPYSIDPDETDAQQSSTPRPDPIATPHLAWASIRQHDLSLAADLTEDSDICAALSSPAVSFALANLHAAQRSAASYAPFSDQDALLASASVDVRNSHVEADDQGIASDGDVSLTRTVSLSRRNAVRGTTAGGSDSTSIRSSRSGASRPRTRPLLAGLLHPNAAESSNSAATGAGEMASTSHEGRQQNVLASRPGTSRRRSSFTFVTTPAAVLRSEERSQSRGNHRPSESGSSSEAAVGESDAEELVDLDLHLGLAGAEGFEFDLGQFLRNVSRPSHSRQGADGLERYERLLDNTVFDNDSDNQLHISGSGASTPAEARQATFEAYAQRARLIERRRRMLLPTSGDQIGVGSTNSEDADDGERQRRQPARRTSTADMNSAIDSGEPIPLPFPRDLER